MKKYTHYVRLCLTGIFLVMAFFCNGCSVFSFVGDSISQGYENMVSYFNGYYNAKRLFADAEDEIKMSELQARGKQVPAGQANQIPATAKQKFGQVIDKCSNILAFHSSSSLVDNALLLIGKSFFYQMEYLKAERKFAELLTQYPNSSLALEAQLWYARSEEKLGKLDDGVRLGDATVLAAQATHEREIETQAHLVLSVLYRRMNQTDKAIAEYEKAISLTGDDFVKGEAQISLGDVYFTSGQYDKAAETYLQTENYTSDIYSTYYSKLQAAIAYRQMGEQKKGLTLIDAMIEDFHYRDYLSAILYERANNYAASGRRNDAINTYILVDTSYAKTEYSVRSAYHLELIFEKELGLYGQALKYDSVVNTAAGLDIVAEGQRKFIALTHYFAAWRQLNKADSLLLVLSDTTHKIFLDTLHAMAPDSVHTILTNTLRSLAADSVYKKNADTLHAAFVDSTKKKIMGHDSLSFMTKADSLRKRGSIPDTTQKQPVMTNKPVLPSADSLRTLKSLAAQELGDIFYSEIVVPDSSFTWYNNALRWGYTNTRSPRILFILAELSRTNPEKKYPAPEEYYSRLDRDFPESAYAEEARRFLQKSASATKTDTAVEYYAQSEKQIDAKEYEKAIGTLRSLVRSFPKSPVAAKSEYAIGWIMENRLAQPDSARAQYKRVAKNYEGTAYALAASRRYTEEQQSDTTKKDTTKVKMNTPFPKPVRVDSVQRNTAVLKKDTVEQQPVPPEKDIESGRRNRPISKPKILNE
jgi:tetratricopeptide (TPR) repeat protein